MYWILIPHSVSEIIALMGLVISVFSTKDLAASVFFAAIYLGSIIKAEGAR